MNWVIYNKQTMEIIGEVVTNHSISTEDAIDLMDPVYLEKVNIDDPDFSIDGKEYWYDDIDVSLEDDFYDFDSWSTDRIASFIRNAGAWDEPNVEEAMNELCNRAGRKLRKQIADGEDCSEAFELMRLCASEEWFADTPDVSEDEEDMIDWLRHGAEQGDPAHVCQVIQHVLSVDMGI